MSVRWVVIRWDGIEQSVHDTRADAKAASVWFTGSHVERREEGRSELAQSILQDLRDNGPSTSHDIAQRLNVSARSVAVSCGWLRGAGEVSDGSTWEEHDWGIAVTSLPRPVWQINTRHTRRAIERMSSEELQRIIDSPQYTSDTQEHAEEELARREYDESDPASHQNHHD